MWNGLNPLVMGLCFYRQRGADVAKISVLIP